jgi:hypothetical protein
VTRRFPAVQIEEIAEVVDPEILREKINRAVETRADLEHYVAVAEGRLALLEDQTRIPLVTVRAATLPRFAITVRMLAFGSIAATATGPHHADRLLGCEVGNFEAAGTNALRIAREVDGLIDWDHPDAVRKLIPPELDYAGNRDAAIRAWRKRRAAPPEGGA